MEWLALLAMCADNSRYQVQFECLQISTESVRVAVSLNQEHCFRYELERYCSSNNRL
jgi:hypothetical protein